MIGVITRQESDITKVLEINSVNFEIIPDDFKKIKNYNALLILGGTEEEPLKLSPRQYLEIDKMKKTGIKIFIEYVVSFGSYLSDGYIDSRNERIVYNDESIENLNVNEIIDLQHSFRMIPFHEVLENKKIIASFTKDHVHSEKNQNKEKVDVNNFALFYLEDNVLVSSFQMANYHRNRFAPFVRINALVSKVLSWLCNKNIDTKVLKNPYTLNKDNNLDNVVKETLNWFELNDIVIDSGEDGVYEGFGSEIYPDGSQRYADIVRGDCTGEAAFLYYLAGKYFEDDEYSKVANNLFSSALDMFVIQEDEGKGFVRWSNVAFESNYGDDVARMIMPMLIKNIIDERNEHEMDVLKDVLDFHVETTGKDGLRRSRFELSEVKSQSISDVQDEEDVCPSAHYNAYYHAVLFLGAKLFNDDAYLEKAEKGIETLMGYYPNTQREQSQTQEEARLILPLSIAYWVTKESKYKHWLANVSDDLSLRKHDSGAYLEWDEGYKAVMRHTLGDGECSLLSKNGDTVADLLYTNNWLGLGFAFAYLATGEKKYKEELKSIVDFYRRSQMKSDNKNLNGVWSRAFDPKLNEYFGSPADKGWGPYCIESGWTVSQISSGILVYLMIDKAESLLGGIQ